MVLQFIVIVEYSSEDNLLICKETMKNNLAEAIENERQNGALTQDVGISANWVEVHV